MLYPGVPKLGGVVNERLPPNSDATLNTVEQRLGSAGRAPCTTFSLHWRAHLPTLRLLLPFCRLMSGTHNLEVIGSDRLCAWSMSDITTKAGLGTTGLYSKGALQKQKSTSACTKHSFWFLLSCYTHSARMGEDETLIIWMVSQFLSVFLGAGKLIILADGGFAHILATSQMCWLWNKQVQCCPSSMCTLKEVVWKANQGYEALKVMSEMSLFLLQLFIDKALLGFSKWCTFILCSTSKWEMGEWRIKFPHNESMWDKKLTQDCLI